jgi:osmotically-inducible protein OsmY
MPSRHPKSYEEITRETVPNPDSSYRPTLEQERRAYEGYRALDPEEQALNDRVLDALANACHDISRVQVEVSGTRVTLRGQVMNHQALDDIALAVHGVEGVGDVVDRMVVSQ